ncbi:hypothetical protein DCCM_3846 [Desulfocucumis palustris]|uniref:DUF5658 domain-containing protein n=1 Tax=Desulfocucumis palustris TaxID=1898651 RepID=A0A2L2XKA4_9FIRM|nr:DUF5658 family protein [Desulfocucumis palustris]GBF34726.1 hypothetical protein DCCM_3846 [Desulfocucumis palustris]
MPYAIIMVSCVLDHLLTSLYLSRGGGEANPLMAIIMAQPFWVSFIIKNGWTLLMLVFLYFLSGKTPAAAKWALRCVAVLYLGVIACHIIASGSLPPHSILKYPAVLPVPGAPGMTGC